MTDAREIAITGGAPTAERAGLPFLGAAPLIAGESAASYEALLARMTATLKPADILEEIWVRDIVDLVWEAFRLRRLKSQLMTASAHEGMAEVLRGLDLTDPWTTSRRWAARREEAVEDAETALRAAGLGMDAVMARTLSVRIADFERIDRMTMAAEARRNAVLNAIDRHRAAFALRVRAAIDEPDDAELKAIGPQHAPPLAKQMEPACTSAAKLAANRANAQRSTGPRTPEGKRRSAQNARKSTGPRTAAGKARAAQNARRHGLTLAAGCDPSATRDIVAAARAVAGPDGDPLRQALACRIVEAQLALVRVRHARRDLFESVVGACKDIARLAALENYEQRARSRRKFAMRALDAAARQRAASGRAAFLPKRTEAKPNPT
jgi:hypothetical protein